MPLWLLVCCLVRQQEKTDSRLVHSVEAHARATSMLQTGQIDTHLQHHHVNCVKSYAVHTGMHPVSRTGSMRHH